MAHKISILNEKGGVGKTTTSSSIGSILAHLGYRVVMVDIDPQNDLTLSCPIDESNTNLFDCLFNLKKVKGINVNPRLIIIPGSAELSPLNFMRHVSFHEEYNMGNPRLVFKSFFEGIDQMCDFILFDCPPNQEIIVLNALAASDYVLIPTVPHSFSLNGINSILTLTNQIKKINPDLEALGILMNNFDKRNKIDQAVYELCQEQYGSLMFKTPIRINTKLKENTHLGMEIISYAKELENMKIPQKFSGFEDFKLVAEEILQRIKIVAHEG